MLDVLKVSINPTALSNIETIVGIIVAIIGIPGAICAAILKIKKYKKSKNGDDDMDPTNPARSTPIQPNGKGLLIHQESKGTSNSSKSINDVTINFPIALDKRLETQKAFDPSRKIRLNKYYTSLYAENGKLQKELITLNEIGVDGKITGEIKLLTPQKKKFETYLLSATFFNKVINGVYYAKDDSKDECGTINIKQVSEDIYSGVCTFSKLGPDGKETIKSSPYVWVKGENNDLLNGTYDFCKNCSIQRDLCCCSSDKVDMPVILNNETSQLRDKNDLNIRYNISTFAKSINNSPIYQMKHKKDKKPDEPEHCFFYDYQKKKCSVYNYRPIDCRLFPFDIRLNNKKRPGQRQAVDNEYWVGYYPGLCCENLPSKEEMETQIAILRPYFYLLAPFVEAYTRSDVFSRLDNEDFELLYRLRDIIY